ncbi:thiamine pyrophosphate-dependent enzyme [Halomonas alkaliantarctica]|uniref:Thiamine pyrophosphate-dependent enzyme n=1 Tax=Halomonas alkaliantarctica TaxID=232346 RepID=A0ABY8LP83_9GAMM|nr:thiamine pyrophosphate-dependent enzyme [Halomonas alkaliantarctica]WGI25209.1 thiamine pyrophosphate-dependent enzyme [Halomonas alkaliantarctica]
MREKIKLVAVVINDEGLSNEHAFQDAYYDGKHFAIDYQNPDFGVLARAFGAQGEKVTRPVALHFRVQS